MSITYKLFKIPKTLDEFVDKAKRTGQVLNISFYKSYPPCQGSCIEYYDTYFELKLEDRVLKLKELFHPAPILPQEALNAYDRYEQKDLEEAIKIAEDLEKKRVKVTISLPLSLIRKESCTLG